MDIICAKCGKHFSSIEAAREHRGHCKETSEGESIRRIAAPKSKITPEEWKSLMKLINPQDVSPTRTPSNLEPTAVESTSSTDSTEPDISMPLTNSEKSKRIPAKKETGKNKRKKTSNHKIPNWLIALLFILTLGIIGLGVSVFVGVFIPFWILLGFSLFYSIEKWFYYPIRKHKSIGKLYRLFLNLSILSLLALIIWSGIKLFSQQFTHSYLIGSLVFLAEFGFFVWMWRIVSKNSWRWPSMKLTIFSLICLFLIFAFAGVRPFTDYKTSLITRYSAWTENMERSRLDKEAATWFQNVGSQTIEQPPPAVEIPTPTPTPTLEEVTQYTLDLINKDRNEHGLPTVSLGNNIAAQKHAEEMLANDYISHWGMDGMKPYMRYTLAGGFNYEAENAFILRTLWYGGKDPFYERDTKEMLDEAQESLMGSPGHRSNILNKWHKKVNIGIAYNKETLALVQQFEGDYIEFSSLPALQGGLLSLSGRTLGGFVVEQVQICYDPLPHSLTLGQLGKTYAYGLGKPAAFVRPPPPPGSYYLESVTVFSWETYEDDLSIPN